MVGKAYHPNASAPMMGRWRFPLLPREFQVALKTSYTDQRTGGQTTHASRINPLFEFSGNLPAFCPELYQVYRLARIRAIHVDMEVVNTSASQPLTATVCCVPLSSANAIVDPRNVASIPNSVSRQVGIAAGMSRVRIQKTFIGEKEFGQLAVSGLDFSQTYGEALATAVLGDCPAIYAGVIATVTGGNWTGVIRYVYTYHIEFTEYTNQLTSPIPHKPDCISEEPSWEEPPMSLKARHKERIQSRGTKRSKEG